MKRVFVLVVIGLVVAAGVMFLKGSLPGMQSNEDLQVYNNGIFTYTVEDGEACLTGLVSDKTVSAEIPYAIGGYPVKRIADEAFANCFPGKDITIPADVEKVGGNAFRGCDTIYIHVSGNIDTSNAPWGGKEVIVVY